MIRFTDEQEITVDMVRKLADKELLPRAKEKDHSVERMMRDAKLTQIYTGTNQITRLVTGRSLLLS